MLELILSSLAKQLSLPLNYRYINQTRQNLLVFSDKEIHSVPNKSFFVNSNPYVKNDYHVKFDINANIIFIQESTIPTEQNNQNLAKEKDIKPFIFDSKKVIISFRKLRTNEKEVISTVSPNESIQFAVESLRKFAHTLRSYSRNKRMKSINKSKKASTVKIKKKIKQCLDQFTFGLNQQNDIIFKPKNISSKTIHDSVIQLKACHNINGHLHRHKKNEEHKTQNNDSFIQLKMCNDESDSNTSINNSDD